jgi:hypothetical protein
MVSSKSSLACDTRNKCGGTTRDLGRFCILQNSPATIAKLSSGELAVSRSRKPWRPTDRPTDDPTTREAASTRIGIVGYILRRVLNDLRPTACNILQYDATSRSDIKLHGSNRIVTEAIVDYIFSPACLNCTLYTVSYCGSTASCFLTHCQKRSIISKKILLFKQLFFLNNYFLQKDNWHSSREAIPSLMNRKSAIFRPSELYALFHPPYTLKLLAEP